MINYCKSSHDRQKICPVTALYCAVYAEEMTCYIPAAERNRQEIDWIRESGGANKPIIASEFGAGANYGFRDRSHCKWTEEYQADVLRDHLNYYLNDPNVSGAFIWQFADCRVSEEVWFAKRARCHNNKGVVDEYRRPKLAYDVVKEMFAVKTGNT